MRPSTIAIGSRQVGEGAACFVLAEVASAHGGSADTALKMLDAAFKMGADGIKFQLFRADHLVVRRHPGRKDFDQIELTAKEWKKVLKAAKGSGLALLAEAFDRPSLELAAEASVDAYKVHTTDMENPEFIRAVGGVGRPVLFATGGVSQEAVKEALDLVGAAPVGLLHGFQTFPTPIEEIRFGDLARWKERYRVPVGFLDHTDGGSAFALVAPALAVGYGADLVEKHFTLDRSEKGFDYQSSLNPEDFYRMVELLRQAERAKGDGGAPESDGARRYHRLMARSIVAASLIPRGEVLTAPMLAFKRTDVRFEPGFAPREAHRVIGRRAARPIQADETIREELLEWSAGNEPRVVAVVSARMASSRYPGKALVPLAGMPLIEVLLRRIASSPILDSVALATSMSPENLVLVEIARRLGVPAFQGEEEDVLRRYVDCARSMAAQHVVRVTGDNPLTDLETLERLVALHLEAGADYTYVPGDALLMGILPEVVSRSALEESWERGEARHRSELVTLYIKEHPGEFKIRTADLPEGLYRPQYRLTVDEAKDVTLMQALFERLGAPGKLVTTREAIELLDREPQLAAINAELGHKAHNVRSVALDAAIAGKAGPPQAHGRRR